MTSFKVWLEHVHIEQIKERTRSASKMLPAVMLLGMLPDEEQDFNELEKLFAKTSGGVFLDSFRELWESYQCYTATEYCERRYPGDTAIYKVRDLGGGCSLWRCINAAGIPYSMIRNADGGEVMNNVREKESDMLDIFNERQQAEQRRNIK